LRKQRTQNNERLKRLKVLLKDDFQSFVYMANRCVEDKIIEPEVLNNLFEKGLLRNYKYNKQQNR
tara:strand:- start:140 stop:334 length:195 start_codon:yes stop_codon:yes gene_type:complete